MPHTYRDMPSAGTTLEVEIGYAFTVIPGATDINWDGFKRSVRNPTHLLSPAVVKKPGMPDFGQIKSKVFYDPNNVVHQFLRDRLLQTAEDASAQLDSFRLTYSDGFVTSAFAEVEGFVSDFSHAMTDPETGTATADLTIEVSSITSFTDGVTDPYS